MPAGKSLLAKTYSFFILTVNGLSKARKLFPSKRSRCYFANVTKFQQNASYRIICQKLEDIGKFRLLCAKKYKFKQVRYEINFSNVEMVMAMIKGEFLILFKGG